MEIIKIENEYDMDEIREKILSKDRVLITADYPGCGKSHIFKTILPKDKTLWITPYNKLCFELIKECYESKTMYKLLELNYLGDGEKKSRCDISSYEYIVFDEVYSYDVLMYQELFIYMKKHNRNIKFYATGDNLQLSAIGVENEEAKYIVNKVMKRLFKFNVNLQEIKRVVKPEHKARLIKLKKDIFEGVLPLREILKEFKEVELQGIKTKKCIAYTNETVQYCNYSIHKKIDVGEWLICKHRINFNKVDYFINYEYLVEKIDNKNITIKEPLSEIVSSITLQQYIKYFRRSIGYTVHQVQGLSFNEPITVCDLNFKYAKNNPNWLWVSLTRNRNLDDIYVCFNDLNMKLNGFDFKLKGYELADREKGFKWGRNEYISESWVIDCLHKQMGCCKRCLISLKVNYEEKDLDQYSVNRINNLLPHISSNCELICYSCNCALK